MTVIRRSLMTVIRRSLMTVIRRSLMKVIRRSLMTTFGGGKSGHKLLKKLLTSAVIRLKQVTCCSNMSLVDSVSNMHSRHGLTEDMHSRHGLTEECVVVLESSK